MSAPTQPNNSPPARETSPPDASTAAKIAASADNWKRNLLDLTKRNRALNFRVNKVSTVAIVDEQPAEVFRQLYVREHAMKFKAAPEMALPLTAPNPADEQQKPAAVTPAD